jgi:hypothetical protein
MIESILRAIVLLRAWLKPDVEMDVTPAQFLFKQRRLSVANEYDATAATGLFLETVWARNWWLRRQPLKLEIVAGEYDAITSPRRRERVDLLISVGSSIRPGAYVARRDLTAFRIRVGASPRSEASGV